MEHHDIIMDQIHQFGRVLGTILADFLGLKSKGQISAGIEIANQNFKSQLDLDIEKIIFLPRAELFEYIKKRKLKGDQIEMIAEYLVHLGTERKLTDLKQAKNIFRKVLELYEMADDISKTVPLDRMNKRADVEKLI